jgi:peptidoglycan/LPS O-acetylase OafA/YrhL
VVLLHLSDADNPFEGYSRGVTLGYVGVSFFFMLSGFVLAWTYRDGDKAAGFYGRRFARVWPLHIFMTLVVVVIFAVEGVQQDPLALAFVTPLLQAWVPVSEVFYAYNGPSWSLSCEAFFYLLFPLVIVRALRAVNPMRWIAAIGGCLIVIVAAVLIFAPMITAATGLRAGAFTYLLYIFPPYRFAEFVIGVMLCVIVRKGWQSPIKVSTAIWIALGTYAALTVVSNFLYANPVDMPNGLADLVMLPAFAILILSAATCDLEKQRTVLHSRVLLRLGKASFALYLVHQPILQLIGRYVPSSGLPFDLLRASVAIVIALIAAELAHRVIEAPIERILRARLGGRTISDLPVST